MALTLMRPRPERRIHRSANPSTTPSGQQVSLAAAGFVYNAVVPAGQAGLFTRGGASTFASCLVKTDAPKLLGAVISTGEIGASVLGSPTVGLAPSGNTSTSRNNDFFLN